MILSVVIPTLDKCALLERTLAALDQQEAGPDRSWEIVVVDDGCHDGTAALLERRAAVPDAPPLRVVGAGRNLGRAAARNLGARAAVGRWLLFLDDDIVAPPGLLRAHLDLLTSRPGLGTIGWARTDPALIDAPHFHYLDSRGVARLGPGPAPARFFVTQNAAVPRAEFLAVGGFDEGFSAYGFEDMEVAFRLEDRMGLRFRALPAPVPRHVHHHTLQQYLDKKVECGRHSLPRLARLHPQRLIEMRLHHVVDPGAGTLARALGLLTGQGLDRRLQRLLAAWPTRGSRRPRWPWLYQSLMNLLILCCFRRGLSEAPGGTA